VRQFRRVKSEEDLPLLLDCNSGDASAGDASAGDASSGDAGSGDAGSGDAGSGDAGSGDDHESLDESFELQQDICGQRKKHATVQGC
jgi:hypothetical protein